MSAYSAKFDETKIKFAARTEELMEIVGSQKLSKELIVCLMMEGYVQGQLDQLFERTKNLSQAA